MRRSREPRPSPRSCPVLLTVAVELTDGIRTPLRDGQAMIATLRHRLICVPARLVRHAAP